MCFARRCYCYPGTRYFLKGKIAFANIFIANIEKCTIAVSTTKPLLWKRHIDYVFRLWNRNKDKIKEFVNLYIRYTLCHDTIIIYGWNIKLRIYILGHNNVQKRQFEEGIDSWNPNVLRGDGDLRILEFSSVSGKWKRILERRSTVPLMKRLIMLTSNKNIQCFKIRLKNRQYKREILKKCISKFDLNGRDRSLRSLHWRALRPIENVSPV